jgi:hypothetical protein
MGGSAQLKALGVGKYRRAKSAMEKFLLFRPLTGIARFFEPPPPANPLA